MAETPESIVRRLLADTTKLEQAVANDRRKSYEMGFTRDLIKVNERLNALGIKVVDAKLEEARASSATIDKWTKL
jgi:hypothetical protein